MNNQELRRRRKALGITQERAAELLGIAFQTYNTYENKGTLTKAKVVLIERVFSELEKSKQGNSVQEEKSEYNISDKKEESKGILENILFEIRELRKENEQLKNSITHYINLNEEEKKINELSRKKLDLSVKALKSLDRELEEMKKSTSAKQNVSNTK